LEHRSVYDANAGHISNDLVSFNIQESTVYDSIFLSWISFHDGSRCPDIDQRVAPFTEQDFVAGKKDIVANGTKYLFSSDGWQIKLDPFLP
jgi:hypothetical protein